MSFTDTLKRSLGFEETQDDNNKDGNPSNFTSTIQDFSSFFHLTGEKTASGRGGRDQDGI